MSNDVSSPLPLVSAIIPTHQRPQLVGRAVRSALLQTYRNLEILVIIDGPEPATAEILRGLSEARMRVVELKNNVGISEVRNIGAREAKGDWISFLSDDDEWLPHKIDQQVKALADSDPQTTLVACKCETRGSDSTGIVPSRFPLPGEDLSEFIYCRSEFIAAASLIRRDVVCSVPYRRGLQNNEDNDWLLRVRAADLLVINSVDEVLAIIHAERERPHLSTHTNWSPLIEWAYTNRGSLTPKSFASFLLRHCIPLAKRNGERRSRMLGIVRRAWLDGLPNPEDLIYAFAFAMVPSPALPIFRRVWRCLHNVGSAS